MKHFAVIWMKIPQRLDLYMYLSSWMLFCVVISTAYAALLSSMMAMPFMTPTIKSFNELAKAQNEGLIKVLVYKHSIYYNIIKVSFKKLIEHQMY